MNRGGRGESDHPADVMESVSAGLGYDGCRLRELGRHHRELLRMAHYYTRRGFAVVPVPAGQKGPVITDWQNLRLTSYQLAHAFVDAGNIGLLLGRMSRDLVDVDLDCEEARNLADQILPETPAITGRASSPRSHRWYISLGVQTTRRRDPVTKASIVELRGTGSQTLVAPSIHPSGESYDPLTAEPALVPADKLLEAVRRLASEVIRLRHGNVAVSPSLPSKRCSSPPRLLDPHSVHRRASAYLARLPAAISGNGGHNTTFNAATALVHGFCLSEREAFGLLRDEYNPRCDPPWEDRELEHKVQQASIVPHRRPHGWLL